MRGKSKKIIRILRRLRRVFRKSVYSYKCRISIITAAILFISILGVSSAALSKHAYASDTENVNRYKSYVSVQIYLGDTLDSISQKYITDEYATDSQYIREVCSINHFSKSVVLIPGNYIIVPHYVDRQ